MSVRCAAAGNSTVLSRYSVAGAAGLLAVAVVGLTWVAPREQLEPDLLADAMFTSITNFEGDEFDAAISPDGAFVTFVGEGEQAFDVWLSQVDTGTAVRRTRSPRARGSARSTGGAPVNGRREPDSDIVLIERDTGTGGS